MNKRDKNTHQYNEKQNPIHSRLRHTPGAGFTIVELLIVIVVIAILAAVTVASYTGIQARARDSIRLQHARQIAQALQIYGLDHGNLIGTGSGCGARDNGSGWFNSTDPSAYYARSILDCLVDEELLDESVRDPTDRVDFSASEQDGKYAYMKYNCSSATATVAYIFIKLEAISESERMSDADICEGPSYNARSRYNAYGMNYWIKVEI